MIVHHWGRCFSGQFVFATLGAQRVADNGDASAERGCTKELNTSKPRWWTMRDFRFDVDAVASVARRPLHRVVQGKSMHQGRARAPQFQFAFFGRGRSWDQVSR
jgi:hypothetical protein